MPPALTRSGHWISRNLFLEPCRRIGSLIGMPRWRLILLVLGVLWTTAAGIWIWRSETDPLVGTWGYEVPGWNTQLQFHANGTCQAISIHGNPVRGTWRKIDLWSEVITKRDTTLRISMGSGIVEPQPRQETSYYMLDDLSRNPAWQAKLWSGSLTEGQGYWVTMEGMDGRLFTPVEGGLLELFGEAPWASSSISGWGRVTPWYRWAPGALGDWVQGKPLPPRVSQYPRREKVWDFNIGYRF